MHGVLLQRTGFCRNNATLQNIVHTQHMCVCMTSTHVGAAGDAATWSTCMQRLLCSCHTSLDTAFLGMDDSSLASAGKAGLDPQAQPITRQTDSPLCNDNAPGRIAGAQHSKQSMHSIAAVQKALVGLTGFLAALERMLTMSYPVAVPLPVHGILMLLTRILSMSDDARQAGEHMCMYCLQSFTPMLHCTHPTGAHKHIASQTSSAACECNSHVTIFGHCFQHCCCCCCCSCCSQVGKQAPPFASAIRLSCLYAS